MTYVNWYIAIGLIVLILVYGSHRLARSYKPKSSYEQATGIDAGGKRLFFTIMNDFIVPLMAASTITLLWPIAMFMYFRENFTSRNQTHESQSTAFTVHPNHLKELLSVDEIEALEAVYDPLGAVPELPFGHLHAAWRRFLEGRTQGDQLWSFNAKTKTQFGDTELREGYVLVIDGLPCGYFLTAKRGGRQ